MQICEHYSKYGSQYQLYNILADFTKGALPCPTCGMFCEFQVGTKSLKAQNK